MGISCPWTFALYHGVTSDLQNYTRQSAYDLREILARDKDFVKAVIKAKPTYLGDAVPVSGNGDVTNDKIFSP